jgi:hypothetical protein
LDIHGCGRLQARPAQRIERENIGSMADLHVRTATTVKPIAFDNRIERRMRPHCRWPRRDDIDMRLQDQRPSPLLAGAMDSDDNRRPGMFVGEWRAARMPPDGILIHLEAIHGVTAVTQRAKDKILHGVLRTARGWKADEILREGNLLAKSLVDKRDDAIANIGIKRHEEMSF